MSTLYLIRHGEIANVSPRRYIGRLDLPLTPNGQKQMAELAEVLSPISIDRVICSPLSRCTESAQILSENSNVLPEIDPNLTEIALGSWEGLTVAEVRKRYPGHYEARGKDLACFRPLGGESFQDLRNRVLPAFHHICSAAGEQIAIVSHAGVNRVLLCHVLGVPLANLFRLEQDYGCVNILRHKAGTIQIKSINLRPGRLE